MRRRVAIADLGADAGEVIEVLAGERLITIGDGEVEVAHEAMLREWPRLREWLREDAESRQLQRHLSRAAKDWVAVAPRARQP